MKDTVEERIVQMREKKPQETAAAGMLRSGAASEDGQGPEDAPEAAQSSLVPSVALLRLGQVNSTGRLLRDVWSIVPTS